MAEEFSKDEFVTVFASRSYLAETEAESIHGVLESAGLNSLIVRENVPELPTGLVEVKVLASDVEDAEKLIEGAREAGRLQQGDEAAKEDK